MKRIREERIPNEFEREKIMSKNSKKITKQRGTYLIPLVKTVEYKVQVWYNGSVEKDEVFNTLEDALKFIKNMQADENSVAKNLIKGNFTRTFRLDQVENYNYDNNPQ